MYSSVRRTAKEFADELRAAVGKMTPKPDRIYSIHNKIRTLTNRFDVPGPEMRDIFDFDVSQCRFPVPVRLYEPFGASEDAGPVLIYLHGGGFVTCSMDSHESLCLRLADAGKIRVLQVDYRLAPQYPFPAGPDDCEHVLKWVLAEGGLPYGLDSKRVAVSGDSAGGNMAAYLAQKYRKYLKAQVLYYPVMQLLETRPPRPGLQDAFRFGVFALSFIKKHYVVDADPRIPRLSPLFEENLKGLPPAYILTCGLDPLRQEGKFYVDKLEINGVPVHYRHEKALPHGFLNFSRAFPMAKKLPLDTGQFLRETLA